jgi:hypothetical protein
MRKARVHKSSEAPVFVDVAPFGLTVGTDLTFSKMLMEAIDDALSSFGEPMKESVYCDLEKMFNIKRCDIPCRIDEFSDALERIFGVTAKLLQIMFMKHLHDRVGIVCKWNLPEWVAPDLTFKQYVTLMKQNYDQSKKLPKRV